MFVSRRGFFQLSVIWCSNFVFTCLSFASLGAAPPDDAVSIIVRMREAAGIQALSRQTGDVVIRGHSTEPESPGEYTLQFTADGRYLRKLDGPLSEMHGYNGSVCWKIDRSGIFRTLELFDRDRCQLLLGIQTGQWLAYLDAKLAAVASQGGDSRTVVLDVKQGRLAARLYVDRATWLPTKLTWPEISGDFVWRFSGYRNDLGWKVPAKIVMTADGNADGSYEIRSLSHSSASPAVYDPSGGKGGDVHFSPQAPTRIEVKRAVTGHVLVHPQVDGLDLGWFVFDTGAGGSTILDDAAAARLKLTTLAKNTVTGVNGTVAGSLARAHSLEIGPLTIDEPILQRMDLAPLQRFLGKEVIGIIGYDLLSRCVAEINLAENAIQIHDPRSYQLAGGQWQKLFFSEDLPLVSAKFEGGEGLFRIDVGASGAAASNVVFHAATVADLKLLDGRKVRRAQLGVTRVALGKLAWFELAGHRFENPRVLFALDRRGPLGRDLYAAGNMGVKFLEPFRIVLDYQRTRVAFVPTEAGK
jgi:hypothetical protein